MCTKSYHFFLLIFFFFFFVFFIFSIFSFSLSFLVISSVEISYSIIYLLINEINDDGLIQSLRVEESSRRMEKRNNIFLVLYKYVQRTFVLTSHIFLYD